MTRRSTTAQKDPEPTVIECIFAARPIYPPLPKPEDLPKFQNLSSEMDRQRTHRILDNASRFLRGDTLYIHSAGLRGPVVKNPWAVSKPAAVGSKRKRDVNASAERHGDAKRIQLTRDERVVVDTPEGPSQGGRKSLLGKVFTQARVPTTPPTIPRNRTINESFNGEQPLEEQIIVKRRSKSTMTITAEGSPRPSTSSSRRTQVVTEDKQIKRRLPPLELADAQSPAFMFRRKNKQAKVHPVPVEVAFEEPREAPKETEADEGRKEADDNEEATDITKETGELGKESAAVDIEMKEVGAESTTSASEHSSGEEASIETGATSPEAPEVSTEQQKAVEETSEALEKEERPNIEDSGENKVREQDEAVEEQQEAQVAIIITTEGSESRVEETSETTEQAAAAEQNHQKECIEKLPKDSTQMGTEAGAKIQVERTPAGAPAMDETFDGRSPDSVSGASETSSNPEPDDSPWVSTQYQLEATRKQFMAALMDTPSSRGHRSGIGSEASRVPQSSMMSLEASITVAPKILNLNFRGSSSPNRTPSPSKGIFTDNAASPFKTFTSPLQSSPQSRLAASFNSQDDCRDSMRPISLFTPQQESLFSQHPVKTHDTNWVDPGDYSFLSDDFAEKENGFGIGFGEKDASLQEEDQLTEEVTKFFDTSVWDIDKELEKVDAVTPKPSGKPGTKPASARAAWTGSAKRRW